MATASNSRASASASSASGSSPELPSQSGEIRLMDFVVFRLILLTIVIVRNAFLPVSGCVSQFLDGFGLCQIGTGRVTPSPTIGRKMNFLLAWVSHAHDGVRRGAARAGLLRWLVMVRCPLVYVNTMFCSNRLSPACSSIILPWTVSPSSGVLSISCTRVHQRRRREM